MIKVSEADNESMMKVRAISTRKHLKSAQNSPKRPEFFNSFVSVSSKKCFLESSMNIDKLSPERPKVKSSKKMIYRSNPRKTSESSRLGKLKINMLQNIYPDKNESADLSIIPFVNLSTKQKKKIKDFGNFTKTHDSSIITKNLSQLKRSLNNFTK